MKRITLHRESEALSSSRADQISRIWQAIAFIEEIRAELRTAPARDTVAIQLTESTQHLVLAATLMLPRIAQPQAMAEEPATAPRWTAQEKERRAHGA